MRQALLPTTTTNAACVLSEPSSGDRGPWSTLKSTMLPQETSWYYLSSSQWRVRFLSRDRPGGDLYRCVDRLCQLQTDGRCVQCERERV